MSELASVGQLRMSFVRVALVVVPLVLFLGVLSGALSGSAGNDPWFASLAKPVAMPPALIFPVAWTLLYILIGFALAIIIAARRAAGRGLAIGLFAAQFVLNLAWSPIFFAAHHIALAFAVILALILLSVVTALAFARVRRTAALLLLPYIAWLCFAAWLNHTIDVMNPGADALAPGATSAQVQL